MLTCDSLVIFCEQITNEFQTENEHIVTFLSVAVQLIARKTRVQKDFITKQNVKLCPLIHSPISVS